MLFMRQFLGYQNLKHSNIYEDSNDLSPRIQTQLPSTASPDSVIAHSGTTHDSTKTVQGRRLEPVHPNHVPSTQKESRSTRTSWKKRATLLQSTSGEDTDQTLLDTCSHKVKVIMSAGYLLPPIFTDHLSAANSWSSKVRNSSSGLTPYFV